MTYIIIAVIVAIGLPVAGWVIGRTRDKDEFFGDGWFYTVWSVGTSLVLALSLAGTLFFNGYMENYHNDHVAECTIKGKEAVANSGSNEYRVYTYQCDTLTVADSITHGRFDSSNFFSDLEVGKTYNMRIVGYRNGFTSSFANILSAEEVPSR